MFPLNSNVFEVVLPQSSGLVGMEQSMVSGQGSEIDREKVQDADYSPL